ncbi:MAG: tetratricopeptide repeat protein [Chloroflexi bacterium]|nr:tetratricopeptide repeat protein [Chloroflexota bacterium]
MVRRQRLVDFLHQNVDQPLQLICAPAGYGKTTLMADFAADTELTVCWLAVDELDRDPRSFATSLFEALHTRFPNLENPAKLVQAMSQEANADWQTMIHSIVDGISKGIPEYFIFVIDDFHIVSSSPEVHDALDFVLQRLPDNCRIILSTRELPQIASLPKLISQRSVAGLGPGELKFTSDEIKDLLKKHFDLEVSDEEAKRMEQESEGWITAILLTTHSLWKGLFQEVLSKQGENTLLYEYMASEVFSQQPMVIQDFLLATSIFNEFDAECSRAVTDSDNVEEILKEIEGRNLFVSRIEGAKPWFRYHHLFRDFLRDKIATEDPARQIQLHAKAADYHLQRGDVRQAIHFNIVGHRYDEALDLLEDEVESLAREGLWDTLGGMIEQIPEEFRERRSRLLLYFANYHEHRGRNDESIKILSRIIEVFREEGNYVLESRALMRRSVALRAKGASQMAVRDARMALSITIEYGSLRDQADAHSHLGRAYGTQGKFPMAEEECKLALEGYQQEGDLFQLSHTHGMLGLAYTEMGQFPQAATHYEMAVQGWKKIGNERDLALTLGNVACLYYQQGRYDEAVETGNESLEKAVATNNVRTQSYAYANLGDVRREQGAFGVALGHYQKALDLARECTLAPMVSYCSINMGETYRLMGDKLRAKGLLKEGLSLANDLDLENERGLAYTSLGIIEAASGNTDESITVLDRACELLQRANQKRNLALAKFHMAHVFFQTKNYDAALEYLEQVASLCQDLGHVQFLLEDAKHASLMLQYLAASDGNLRQFFNDIKDEISRQSDGNSPAANAYLDPEELPINGSSNEESDSPTEIEVKGFGQLRIYLGGNPILNSAWGSSKAQEMFLYMLRLREPASKADIMEALWPHISASKANSNFHSTLHRMKSALHPQCVEANGELYQMNPNWGYTFDVGSFEETILNARNLASNNPERILLLSQAVKAYKNPVLGDTDAAWCNQLRTELETAFWQAVNELSDSWKASGNVAQSLSILEEALEVDEYQEEIYHKLADLYTEAGDLASASSTQRRLKSIFGETIQLFAASGGTSDAADSEKH